MKNKTKEYELGQLLSYEQPTEFIVNSTEYNDSYNIPVLTAGKSFIIGYTNETEGVYSNYPVIIFDDFTTSSQYVDFPFKVKSSAMKILSVNKELADLKYLYLLMQTIEFNAANHKRYWISEYSKLKIDLPPLEEQRRIVKRIESLFAKLDSAKEKAQNVVDSFEVRKAAVLHKAFSGELTASWRKQNDVADDSWEDKMFDSCIKKMQNGLSKRSGEEGKETVVLRLANLGETNFDISDLRTIKLTEKEIENYTLYSNDVVMIRVNGSKSNVARQILVTSNDSWSFCDHIIRIVYESFCLPNYMVYFSCTKKYKDYIFENMVSSAGQNTISRKGLANLEIPIPTLPEQQEIVRILDNILQKEQKAKQAAQTVLQQIDLLKKSILARAFRGEL